MSNISDEQLLKMAMGVSTGDAELDATADVLRLKAEWEAIPERRRDILTKRKKMRHNMFKIIKRLTRELEMTEETTPDLLAIKAIIDPQLEELQKANKQMNWFAFTFHWDLNPKDHTQIVTKDRWFAEGGDYDELGALRPTAFTEQEIS
jgi:hypothetical protein